MTQAPHNSKLAPCNLILKGAVAAGVIYPSVISQLKTRYSFRRIGGTSAGAIAAAGAAAAEYRRQKALAEGDVEHMDAGFHQLDQLRDELAQPGFLQSKFQPSHETKPLLDILSPLLVLLGQNKQPPPAHPLLPILRLIQFLWRQVVPPSILRFCNEVLLQWTDDYDLFKGGKQRGRLWGSVVGAICGLLLALAVTGLVALFIPLLPVFLAVFLLSLLLFGAGLCWFGGWLGTWLVGVATAVQGLYGLSTENVVHNNFGICIGHNSDPTKNDLTDWLYETYNRIADLPIDNPLTFGHLKQAGQGIDLRIVSSNLSHARPYILPNDLVNFIWNEEEFQHLFPPQILMHLRKHENKLPGIILPEHYFFFPEPEFLPVIVAARLSISYPILISAVPLYTISAEETPGSATLTGTIPPEHLQKNWFSDGGICSNLPIQFFDEWLPTYPTFGINLTSLRPLKVDPEALSLLPKLRAQMHRRQGTEQQQTLSQSKQPSVFLNDPQVYLPKADDPYTPEWVGQNSLFSFLQAILGTGLYHRELFQIELPSYRECIVQVRMTPEEDGLHLDMSPTTIQGLIEKGRQAGLLLTDTSKGFNFTSHEWVRLQVLIALLDDDFKVLVTSQKAIQQDYQHLLEIEPDHQDEFPFPQNNIWCEDTIKRLRKLLSMSQDWQALIDGAHDVEVFASGPLSIAPHRPVLQIVPEF